MKKRHVIITIFIIIMVIIMKIIVFPSKHPVINANDLIKNINVDSLYAQCTWVLCNKHLFRGTSGAKNKDMIIISNLDQTDQQIPEMILHLNPYILTIAYECVSLNFSRDIEIRCCKDDTIYVKNDEETKVSKLRKGLWLIERNKL